MSFCQGLRWFSAKRRRTVSRDRLSWSVSLTIAPANSSSVQRARPSGGLEHAVATSRASSLPVSLRSAPAPPPGVRGSPRALPRRPARPVGRSSCLDNIRDISRRQRRGASAWPGGRAIGLPALAWRGANAREFLSKLDCRCWTSAVRRRSASPSTSAAMDEFNRDPSLALGHPARPCRMIGCEMEVMTREGPPTRQMPAAFPASSPPLAARYDSAISRRLWR